MVRGARRARHPRHPQGAGGAGGAQPALCLRFPDPPGFPCLLRDPWCRLPGGDRGRSHVCRHGTFRPPADPARLVRDLPAGAGAELFRPSRAADHRSLDDRESVLPALPRLSTLRAGRVLGDRDRDRLAGDHFRRVLADSAVDPARLPAAHADPPHHEPCDRADLRAAGELAARRRHARRGLELRHLGRARRRLWHRRLAPDGHHHAARSPGRDPVGLLTVDRGGRERLLLRDRRDLLLGQFDQAVRGGLVSAAARGLRRLPDADLAQRREAR
ncbi:hypothetical protein ACVWYK_003414 [Bradyrhizobium sp. USDA 4470]